MGNSLKPWINPFEEIEEQVDGTDGPQVQPETHLTCQLLMLSWKQPSANSLTRRDSSKGISESIQCFSFINHIL
jgi:hypothetical protein